MSYLLRVNDGFRLVAVQRVIIPFLSTFQINNQPVTDIWSPTEPELEKRHERDHKDIIATYRLGSFGWGNNMTSFYAHKIGSYGAFTSPLREALRRKEFLPDYSIDMGETVFDEGYFFKNADTHIRQQVLTLARQIKEKVPGVEEIICSLYRTKQDDIFKPVEDIINLELESLG